MCLGPRHMLRHVLEHMPRHMLEHMPRHMLEHVPNYVPNKHVLARQVL